MIIDYTSDNINNDEFDYGVDRYYRLGRCYSGTYKTYIIKGNKIYLTYIAEDEVEGRNGARIKKGDIIERIFFYKTPNDVLEMLKNGDDINLENTYIKDFDITEVGDYKNKSITKFNASGSIWDGKTNFSGLKFENCEVDFYAAEFIGHSNYNSKGVDFSNVVFENSFVHFVDTIFENNRLDFSDAKFIRSELSFKDASFDNTSVTFDRFSIDLGIVNFGQSYFNSSPLTFLKSTFGEGQIHFDYSIFKNGRISFEKTEFGDGDIIFEGSKTEEIDFSNAKLKNGEIIFRGSETGTVIFKNNNFRANIDLRMKKNNELVVENCTIENTFKCDQFDGNYLKYQRLSFLESRNLGQIYIDFRKNNVFDALNNYSYIEATYEGNEKNFSSEEKASQFYMLKENSKKLGNFIDEDRAYRAYMKYSTNKFPRCFLKIFKPIGSYGTRPLTILLASIITIILFGFMNYFWKAYEFVFESKLFESIYFSAITFLTIGYGNIKPVQPLPAILSAIEGFLGLVFVSYLTVSMVRKLLR